MIPVSLLYLDLLPKVLRVLRTSFIALPIIIYNELTQEDRPRPHRPRTPRGNHLAVLPQRSTAPDRPDGRGLRDTQSLLHPLLCQQEHEEATSLIAREAVLRVLPPLHPNMGIEYIKA